jgi:hypothetical protein
MNLFFFDDFKQSTESKAKHRIPTQAVMKMGHDEAIMREIAAIKQILRIRPEALPRGLTTADLIVGQVAAIYQATRRLDLC